MFEIWKALKEFWMFIVDTDFNKTRRMITQALLYIKMLFAINL